MHSGLWKCADSTLCSAGRRSWQGTTRPAAADLEASPHRSARLLLDPKGCGAVKQERSDVSALFKGGRDIARTGAASGTVPNASQRPSSTRRCSKPSYVLFGPAAEEEQIPFTFASSNSSIGPFAAHAACRRYTCGCPTRACTFVLDLRAGMARSTNSQVTKPYPHPCSGVILAVKCQLPHSRHTFRRA